MDVKDDKNNTPSNFLLEERAKKLEKTFGAVSKVDRRHLHRRSLNLISLEFPPAMSSSSSSQPADG